MLVRVKTLAGGILQIQKRKISLGILCIMAIWIFYLYCRSLGDVEYIDMSQNGVPSRDPHDRIGVDTAHLRAKRHRGTWVFAVNEYQQFLFVKRTPGAAVCPSTWSLLGEHCKFGESYDDCAKRCLREEIAVLSYRDLVPLERDPVLLHLDYGRRVDKQWTKIYTVRIRKDTLRKSDMQEMVEFTWVNFTAAEFWLHQCPDGKCRYCNPAKVWKMLSNHSFSFYYSFIEMTVEYLNRATAELDNSSHVEKTIVAEPQVVENVKLAPDIMLDTKILKSLNINARKPNLNSLEANIQKDVPKEG